MLGGALVAAEERPAGRAGAETAYDLPLADPVTAARLERVGLLGLGSSAGAPRPAGGAVSSSSTTSSISTNSATVVSRWVGTGAVAAWTSSSANSRHRRRRPRRAGRCPGPAGRAARPASPPAAGRSGSGRSARRGRRRPSRPGRLRAWSAPARGTPRADRSMCEAACEERVTGSPLPPARRCESAPRVAACQSLICRCGRQPGLVLAAASARRPGLTSTLRADSARWCSRRPCAYATVSASWRIMPAGSRRRAGRRTGPCSGRGASSGGRTGRSAPGRPRATPSSRPGRCRDG